MKKPKRSTTILGSITATGIIIAFTVTSGWLSGDSNSTILNDVISNLVGNDMGNSTNYNSDFDIPTPPNPSNLGYTISDTVLTYNNVDYSIIDVDGGNRDGDREALVAVDIGFGDRVYWGLTNKHGQLVYVLADAITLQNDDKEHVNSDGRYYDDEANVPGTESPDLDQGHIIADSLGGVANAYNITPQDSTLNRHGDQAYMEEIIRDANGCTEFVAIITYSNDSTQTPSSYHYEYILKGTKITDDFKNKSPE